MSSGSELSRSPPSVPSSESSRSSEPPRTPPNLHQNSVDPESRWLVQKFGGTSVGKCPVKIAQDIVSKFIDNNKVAVVCSARSGSTKAMGTTNLLLHAASQALKGRPKVPPSRGIFGQSNSEDSRIDTPLDSAPLSPQQGFEFHAPLALLTVPQAGQPYPAFNVTIDLIRNEHLDAARASIKDQAILKELEDEIDKDCDGLRNFLFAAHIINEISPRVKDNIVGLGEQMACKIMTAVLRDQGIDAEYVSLDDVVPDILDLDGVNNETLDQTFFDQLTVAVGERIKECTPRVPVVTGFFGPIPGSLLDQIGRGYTDVLSSLLAVGLDAAELQIWKEVDGIFTADPRKVATARLLSFISPEEAAELTYYGSEVVHPFAMEQAIRKEVPIRIKNVNNPNGGGTVIFSDDDVASADLQQELSPSKPTSFSDPSQLTNTAACRHLNKLPTAVTIKDHILVLNVNSNRKSVSHGFLAGIFGTLDRLGVVVDLISTSEVHVSMAISDELPKKVLDKLVKELKKSGPVSIDGDMAILSLVGKHMRNMVGIAGRMFTTLAKGGVNIEMISQGASEINISCVIAAKDADKALHLIHQSCLQIEPESAAGRVGPWLF